MDLADKVHRIVNRRRRDGAFHYSNDDVKNVLPVILLRSPSLDANAFGDATLRMVTDFLATIGVDWHAAGAHDFDTKLEQHWKHHPVNQALVRELQELGLELAIDRDDETQELRRFAGESRTLTTNGEPAADARHSRDAA